MSRMNHVMQVGVVEGSVRIYIEDYAYTYLKKQRTSEKSKYFLYGEREANEGEEKIYIYGIAESPKMERTYFKEYYPVGYLRFRDEEKYWVDMKGKEHLVKGFFVFYAHNQAMQEYLIDQNEKEQTASQQNTETVKPRRILKEAPPMKEILIPAGRRRTGKKNTNLPDRLVLPVGFALIVFMIAMGLMTSNGRKKIQIFKEVVTEAMSDSEGSTEEFVVEERDVSQLKENFEWENQGAGEALNDGQAAMEIADDSEDTKVTSEETEETMPAEEEQSSIHTGDTEDNKETAASVSSEVLYISYTVKEGDTLASICQNYYGSLSLMEEICNLNEIKNADRINPGQKLYLPNK